MFNKYDISGNGKLEKLEFKQLCRALGYNLTDSELDLDMKLLDLSGDGHISFSEFQKWWKSDRRFGKLQWNQDRMEIIEELTKQFKRYYFLIRYDSDGSGKLDKSEFTLIHEELLTGRFTTVPTDTAFRYIDTTGDGKIDFAEYARFMLSKDGKF